MTEASRTGTEIEGRIMDMSTSADLKALEERAYRQTWNDGLLDIFAGAGILAIGILFRTELAGLAGMFVAVLLMPFWAVAKKLITVPRLGYVSFGEARKATERSWAIRMIVLGVLALSVGTVLYMAVRSGGEGIGGRLGELNAGFWLMGLLLAVGLVAGGLMIGVRRLLVYGLVMVLAMTTAALLGFEVPDYLVAGGAVILLSGLAVLGRFLRRYPRRAGAGEG